MKFTRRVVAYFNENIGFQTLITLLLLLGVVYLLMLTHSLWTYLFNTVRSILFPFILGFVFAYLVYPITRLFERYKIPRALSLLIVILGAIGLIVLLFLAVIPNLIEDLTLFGQNIVESVQQLYNMYVQSSDDPSEIILGIYSELVGIATEITKQIPVMLTSFLSGTVSFLTTILFSLVIGVYFVIDYERFTHSIGVIARRIHPRFYLSLKVVDRAIKGYIRTEIVLMSIAFVEYTLLYWLVGHNYALILGVLTALSMLIPYIGPTIVHGIGILTSLTLGIPKTILITVLLIIFSQLDGYFISPMVFSKRDKLEPLWSLFSFFACSVLFGFVGILISMPLYFSINSILRLRANNWNVGSEIESV